MEFAPATCSSIHRLGPRRRPLLARPGWRPTSKSRSPTPLRPTPIWSPPMVRSSVTGDGSTCSWSTSTMPTGCSGTASSTSFTEPDLLVLDDEAVAACWPGALLSRDAPSPARFTTRSASGGTHLIRPSPCVGPGRPTPLPGPGRPGGKPNRNPGTKPSPRPSRPGSRRPRFRAHRRMYARAEQVAMDEVVEEGGGMFRRTRIPRTRAALDDLGRRLATEALEMLDAELTVYPTPALEHCGVLRFPAPVSRP